MKNSIEEDKEIIQYKMKIIRNVMNNFEDELCENMQIKTDEVNKALEHILSDYKRVLKENENLKSKNKTLEELLQGNLYELYKYYKELANAYQGNCIPVQKVKDILNEINKEYIKQEEIFNKYFEKENRNMEAYYIQKEATDIMKELSWVEGKLQELLERRK